MILALFVAVLSLAALPSSARPFLKPDMQAILSTLTTPADQAPGYAPNITIVPARDGP